MKAIEAVDLTYRKLEEQGLRGWTVRLSKAKGSLGHCEHSNKTIALSRHWLAVLDDEEIINTIIHEVAHAIAGYKAGHGPEWRRICLGMGGSATRTGGEGFKVESKYVGKCPGNHVSIQRHALSAAMKEDRFYCKACLADGLSVTEARLTWTHTATGEPIKSSVQTTNREVVFS